MEYPALGPFCLQLYSTWAKAGEEVVRDLEKPNFLEYAQRMMTIFVRAAKLCFWFPFIEGKGNLRRVQTVAKLLCFNSAMCY